MNTRRSDLCDHSFALSANDAGCPAERICQSKHFLTQSHGRVLNMCRVHMSSSSRPSPILNPLPPNTLLQFTPPLPTSSISSRYAENTNTSLHFHGSPVANSRAWYSRFRQATLLPSTESVTESLVHRKVDMPRVYALRNKD